MRNRIRTKLYSEEGTLLIIVLLVIAVAAAFMLIIVIPGYKNHLDKADLTCDAQSVVTAVYVAEVTYLQDGESGPVLYYYDELTHKCLDREHIDEITPYGRSRRELNLNGETGAVGVPNTGGDNGAQFLCVLVEEGYDTIARWCGKTLTYEDYNFMTPRERQLLTNADLDQMRRNAQLEQITDEDTK